MYAVISGIFGHVSSFPALREIDGGGSFETFNNVYHGISMFWSFLVAITVGNRGKTATKYQQLSRTQPARTEWGGGCTTPKLQTRVKLDKKLGCIFPNLHLKMQEMVFESITNFNVLYSIL